MTRTRLFYVALALVSALSISGAARAGFTIGSAINTDSCIDPLETSDPNAGGMNDPNTVFLQAGDTKLCQKLCKQGAVDCAQYVRLATSCEKSELNDEVKYFKKDCELIGDPVQTKACKASLKVEAAGELDSINTDRDNALANCQTWLNTCLLSCVP
jgi:hypothetical protein